MENSNPINNFASQFSSQFHSLAPFKFSEEEQLSREGSTCHTYKVRIDGQLFFLKRLKEEYAADPRHIVALQKEFFVGKSLNHPVLVKYEQMDQQSILMEYVKGSTLSELICQDPNYFQDKKQAQNFIRDLLSGLSYMHQHQVLHLDLKPDNIMITDIGHRVKIIDLGYCYTDRWDNTRGYAPSYAAPEQIRGGEITEATDIYALGKVLEWINRKCNKKIFPKKVIRKCTAESPLRRYKNVAELEGDLSTGKTGSHRTLWMAALAVAGFTAFFLNSKHIHHPKPLLQIAHPGSVNVDSAADGVYVMDWKGRLVEPNKWDSTYQAQAVALLTPQFRTRIALHDQDKQSVWGPDGYHINITKSLSEDNSDPAGALDDYRGEFNTREFYYCNNFSDTTALYKAHRYMFPDGTRGYLPALGQMYILHKYYQKQVNYALSRCGGDSITRIYWTSTQCYSPSRIWCINCDEDSFYFAQLRNGTSSIAREYGAFYGSTRAFGALKRKDVLVKVKT